MQQSKNQANRKMSISFLANAFNSVYIDKRKVLRSGYSQFVCRLTSGRIIEKFIFIGAFIYVFLLALPSRTMRQSAIKSVIDAVVIRPRIPWQHHRLTNRVT
jgi:hypothetical protein